MNILSTIRARFRPALESVDAGEIEKYLEMIKPSQDPQFGDYQANCAMPLGKQLGESPREVASRIVAALDLQNMCHTSLPPTAPACTVDGGYTGC